jgi:hypothetical protein
MIPEASTDPLATPSTTLGAASGVSPRIAAKSLSSEETDVVTSYLAEEPQ